MKPPHLITLFLLVECWAETWHGSSCNRLAEPGISVKPSDPFENEIRRLNTAWRSKNFPQNNRCARRVWGTQSLFPNCVGRCADARLIICSRDGHLCPRSSLRLFNPRTRLVSLGRNRWRHNDALDFRWRNFRGLLQYHDFLCLLAPGPELRFSEGPHRCRWLDRRKWPRWNLCARQCFRRWRRSCRLAQGFQKFPDALFVGFRSRSLNGLWNSRLRWRTLRSLTPSLRLFL